MCAKVGCMGGVHGLRKAIIVDIMGIVQWHKLWKSGRYGQEKHLK